MNPLQQLQQANETAGLLLHVAARLPAQRVGTLVAYLGAKVSPLVVTLLRPRLTLTDDSPSPGTQALQQLLAGVDVGSPAFTVKSVETRQVVSSGPNLEECVLDAVVGRTTAAQAADVVLAQSSDPLQYLQLNAGVILPWELAFLPRHALSRAAVLLRLGERLMPDQRRGRVQIAHLVCQMAIKTCHFDECILTADRVLADAEDATPVDRAFLLGFRACARAALGDVNAARDEFRAAVREADRQQSEDTTAVCFALTETYRLGLAMGDWTGLIDAVNRLFRSLAQCASVQASCSGWGMAAVCQQQMGHHDNSAQNLAGALANAREASALDAELDLCNLSMMMLSWQGRDDELIAAARQALPLLELSGNALVAARIEALLAQKVTRESPAGIAGLPADWHACLPAGQRRPVLDAVHVLAARSHLLARHSREQAWLTLAPAVRACESVRRVVAENQLHRFLLQFLEVYRAFLDLGPEQDWPAAEHDAVLRQMAQLFADKQKHDDAALARALLQIRQAARGEEVPEEDRLGAALMEADLDPDNGPLQMDVAAAWYRKSDFEQARAAAERASQLTPGRWEAHRLLGLLAAHKEQWADALAHYERARACDAHLPLRVRIGFAECAKFGGQPRLGIALLEADAERMTDPAGLGVLAGCFAAIGEAEREADCLVRLLKCDGLDPRIVVQMRSRLMALGRTEQPTPPPAPVAPTPTPIDEGGKGSVSAPERYRPCEQCGRPAFDGGAVGPNCLLVAPLDRISGVKCGSCGGFFCLYPCSLQGPIDLIRLCPRCRVHLAGVMPYAQ